VCDPHFGTYVPLYLGITLIMMVKGSMLLIIVV